MGNKCPSIDASGNLVPAPKPSLSGGQIAGIVIGSVGGAVVLVLFVALLLLITARLRHRKAVKIGVNVREELKKKLDASKYKIPKQERLTLELRTKILKSTTAELILQLKARAVTSVELLVTFYERALELNKEYNFIVDTNFDEALELALKCDDLRKVNSDLCNGSLFGIPISVKESFSQKGFDMTSGCTAYLKRPMEDDALAIKLLRAEGAIPFVRTNVPQGLFSCVTDNNIWGETTNPWNKLRSPGGSSGGEAAIIACRASPLGIGTDIAGSLRIPAAFCGLYSFMPTQGRAAMKGHDYNSCAGCGNINITSVCGPIGTSSHDLELMCKALMSPKLFEMGPDAGEPHMAPLPWDETKAKLPEGAKLRIGFVDTFDFFVASLAARRAVRETIDKLKANGHQVVEIKIPFFQDYLGSHIQLMAAEGNLQSLRDKLKTERLSLIYNLQAKVTSLGAFARKLAGCLMRLRGERKIAFIIGNSKKLSAYEHFKNSCYQKQIRRKFFQIWEENELDAFICPAFPIPAMKTKSAKDISIASCYTMFFNYLNLPTGCVPVTLVNSGEDVYDGKSSAKQQQFERCARKDMKDSVGMPMNIQVATLPWQDEKCVAVMKEIEREIPFYKDHDLPNM